MTAPKAKSAAPAEALVERFKEALARLWPEGGKLGLAVSGGPDSLAMLLLAEAAIPGQFEVATVDHGLRPEAADECAMVARVCAERGIPCEVLRVQLEGGNVQAAAREARYSFLSLWAEQRGLSALATAHHLDDQAETVLMRFNRGSGLAGLAGVRERIVLEGWEPGSEVVVIRPLLDFTRQELAEVVADTGLQPSEDPSNADDRFDRVRIRKALANADWLSASGFAASARHLADANEALSDHFERFWRSQVSQDGERTVLRPDAPRATLLRAVERAVSQFGGGEVRGGDVARLLGLLSMGSNGNLAGVLATVEGDDWVFRREPPRRTG